MTAEAAVALPVLVAVLVVALWAVGAATARLRCQDAAHEGARVLARGEPTAAAVAAASRRAPAGAEVVVARAAGLVSVRVRAVVRPPGGPIRLPGLPVEAAVSTADDAAGVPAPVVPAAGPAAGDPP